MLRFPGFARHIALALVSAGAITVAGTAQADAEPLKVGMSGGYFPFTFVEQDTLKGFEVDVMEAVADEMGTEVAFETANFSGLFGMLESGRIDTIANQITITEERQAKYAFTEPYVYDGAQVVVKKGNETISGVEDLRGKSVAVNLAPTMNNSCVSCPMPTRSISAPTRATSSRIPPWAVWMPSSWIG